MLLNLLNLNLVPVSLKVQVREDDCTAVHDVPSGTVRPYFKVEHASILARASWQASPASGLLYHTKFSSLWLCAGAWGMAWGVRHHKVPTGTKVLNLVLVRIHR